MSTECYAMVRGQAIRATGLDSCGSVPRPATYAVSKSVASVRLNEVVVDGTQEFLSTPEDEKRLRLSRSSQTIRYKADIEFLRVDPGMLSLIAGVPLVHRQVAGGGFGVAAFGEGPFGDMGMAELEAGGFDSTTRLRPKAFALEVWSKLAGQRCADGQQQWGYTLFPYLKGGYLSGFQFSNGLVSFNLLGAQTRRGAEWGYGPHDLEGAFQRLTSSVSRNTSFRQVITTGAPPAQTDGIYEVEDVLSNGTPTNPMPDPSAPFIVNGGTPASAGSYTISGGQP